MAPSTPHLPGQVCPDGDTRRAALPEQSGPRGADAVSDPPGGAQVAPGPTRSPRRNRRRRRLLLAVAVLVVLVAVLAWAGGNALRAQTHLQAVRADVAALRETPPDGLAPLLERLRADRDRATAARRLLDQPGPRVVAAVPLLGQSLAAERAVARAGEAVLSAAVDAGGAVDGVLADGGVDLAALEELSRRLADGAESTRPALADLAEAETALTPGAVQDAVAEARAALLGVDDTLATAAVATEALGGLLGADGPRTVLVALENNAELRGRAGLVSVFATGTTRDGRLELDRFQQVHDVADPRGAIVRVPAPAEVAAHYGPHLADTTLWKQATMAADGPASAATLAAVAGQSLGRAPDVVVLVDVPAMASVVAATEPVALPDGRTVTGEELVDLLLVDAYEGAGDSQEAQDDRRRRLTGVAAEVAPRLAGGAGADGPSPDLLRALVDAARGRHLAVWSARPDEQAALERTGLAGAVDPRGDDIAMVTANNLKGDKLDFYVERHLAVEVTVGPESADVVQRLHLRNSAPEGLPWYVEGHEEPGRSVSLLDLAASPDASDLAFTADGQPARATLRRESGSTRVVTTVALDRGEDVDLELRYRVPVRDGEYALRLVPQPLARPATVDVTVRAAEGSELGSVTGAERRGGAGGEEGQGGHVRESGPFEQSRRVAVRLHDPHRPLSLSERIARFWSEPVRFG